MVKKSFNNDWNFEKGSGSALSAMFGVAGEKTQITLPHDAAIQEQRDSQDVLGSGNAYFKKENYHYTKKFSPDKKDKDKLFILLFEGIYQNAFVYVNNSFAAKHPYGYGNFFVDITKYLNFDGENSISVTVKNGVSSGRWYTGGGIYRDVFLFVGDRLSLAPQGVHIETMEADGELAIVRLGATLGYKGIGVRKVRLCTEIRDLDGHFVAGDSIPVTVMEHENTALKQKLYVRQPKFWSAEQPVLYQYHVEIREEEEIIDVEEGTFGIRTIQADPIHGLRINGNTVKLRGGCIHHDNGIIGSASFAHAEQRRIYELKKAGYNAIRSAHYPISRPLLEACDQIGMYVMDEFSDVWTTTKVDFDYGMSLTEWWEDDVANMVHKDFNHPSVILYSIGNEIPEVGNCFDVGLGKQIADKIRSMDTTRPLVNCINLMLAVMDRLPEVMTAIGSEENLGTGEINSLMTDMGSAMGKITGSDYVAAVTEEACSHVDITGLNYAAVRYIMDGEKFPNRVIVGSETNPADLDTNWPLVEKLPYVIGDFSWTAWDYLGEAGIGLISYGKKEMGSFYKPYPCKAAYCGDFNIIGDRRPASYWREVIWGLRRQPYIAVQPPQHYGEEKNMTQWAMTDAVHSWTFKKYRGKSVCVEVYSVEEEVALFVNGMFVDRKLTGESKRGIAYFDTVYTEGVIEAVAYTGGREIGRDVLKTADDTIVLKAESDRKVLPADGSDICYIDLQILDGQGVLNTEVFIPVTVSLEGPGQVIGFGSGAPVSEENFFDSTATPFEGRLQAAVRAQRKGTIKVTFQVDGMKPVIVEIHAK